MAAPTVPFSDEVEYPTGSENRYFELTLPGGTLAGDVFVINVTTNVDSVTAITAPADAVQLMAMGGGAGIGVSGGLWWYKVPAVPPTKLTFDWGVGITRRGTLAWTQLRGSDLQLHAQDMGAWNAASVTNHVVPPLTTTVADTYLIAGVMTGSGSDTPTIPTPPWTILTDATQREGRMVGRVLAAAGSTGAANFTTSGGGYRSRVWQIAVSSGGTPAPTIVDVLATGQTDYMPAGYTGDIADTPAIWVDEDNRSRSVILGSRKAVTGGGIDVYGLDGARLSFWATGEVNNVSVRDFKGKAGWGDRILVVGTNRTNSTLTYGWLDRTTRTISAAGSTAVGFEPYGCCLYVSPVNGDVYAFVSEATGGAGGLKQYRLTLTGSTVSGTQVRSMPTATLSEGMICDDATQRFFLTEEAAGFYVYAAEPTGGTTRTTIDTVGPRLVADVEGIAIAYGRGSDPSYLVVSSQGNSSFAIYKLAAPYDYVRSFRVVGDDGLIGDTTDTDGLAITRADLSPWWPDGVLVVHDTENDGLSQPASNFKLVDAGRVFPEHSYRTPISQIAGTDTSTLTAPVDRWVKAPMTPVWYDATAGTWRGILPTGSSGHRFYTLAPGGNVQGAIVDNRTGVRCTAVHHAGTTYVLRTRNASPQGLFAKYDSSLTKIGGDITTGLSGITDHDAQPVCLMRSPNGYLWIAYTSSGAVRVQRSTDDGATWTSSSAVVTQAGVAGPVVLEMSGTTVVLVCTDNLGLGRWVRTIPQGSANIDPGTWTTEALPAMPSGVTSDDHLSLVGMPDGRILGVTKTTGADTAAKPLFQSLVRSTAGVWTAQTLEAGPDEVPPSYTRPRLTRLPSGEVRVVFGGIYGANDLLSRTTAADALGTWSGRSTPVLGPNWSDSAVLPFPSDLAAAPRGAAWPMLMHNRNTKTIWVQWQVQDSAGEIALYVGSSRLLGAYLGASPVLAGYVGSSKIF